MFCIVEVFASVAYYVFKCQTSQVASKLLKPFSHLLDRTLVTVIQNVSNSTSGHFVRRVESIERAGNFLSSETVSVKGFLTHLYCHTAEEETFLHFSNAGTFQVYLPWLFSSRLLFVL